MRLTLTQRRALLAMNERNVGAVVTSFGWTWKQDVREDERKAHAVLAALRRLDR